MKRVEFAGGIALAVFAAGPIFVLVLTAGVLVFELPAPRDAWMQTAAMLSLGLIAMPIGAAISFIPNLIGGFVMASLGVHYPATRRRRVWAAVGALIGSAIVIPFFGVSERGVLAAYSPFGITGAICALIVRYGTRWSDDASA